MGSVHFATKIMSLLRSFYPDDSRPDRICIWGAGANGMRMQIFLRLQKINVAYYGDNNKQKYGTRVLGVPCLPVEELENHKSNIIIIVCVQGYWDEIKSQLQEKGFPYVIDEKELYSLVPAQNKLEVLAEQGRYDEITQMANQINYEMYQLVKEEGVVP